MTIRLRLAEVRHPPARPRGSMAARLKGERGMNATPPITHAHSASPHLCMPEAARKVVSRGLAIARGHLESIMHALERHDTCCVEVLRQIKAVQGAPEKAR